MKITLEQYEKIQFYLNGKMTPQEEKDFLGQIENNISLKENFEFEKDMRQNLASIEDKKNLFEKGITFNKDDENFKDTSSIKGSIKKAGAEWEEGKKRSLPAVAENIIDKKYKQQTTKVVHLKSWIIWTAAACLVVAIIGVIWFVQKPASPSLVKTNENSVTKKDSNTNVAKIIPNDSLKNINSPDKKIDYRSLFKKYYAKDESNPEMPELLAMVPHNYKNGEYSILNINLDNLPNTRGSSKDLNSKRNILQFGHYYKGLSFIETNDDKKAVENLQWVIGNSTSEKLKIKAQWYLALVCLKNGENKKAVHLLSSLSENNTAIPYNKKAKDILLAVGASQNHN